MFTRLGRFAGVQRSFHTYSARKSSVSSLNQVVKKEILERENVSEEHVLNMLRTCSIMKGKISQGEQIDSLIEKIFDAPNVKITPNILRKFWLTKPSFANIECSIQSYYDKNKDLSINREDAMIPFRQFLWDGEVDKALKIVDLTTAHSRYISTQKSKMRSYLIRYAGSCFGLIGAIEVLTRIFFADVGSLGKVYAMVLAYIGNTSFLASLAFTGKNISQDTGPLRWRPGTLQNYWYQHNDELMMCSKVLEVDAEIHGSEGFATKEIIQNFFDRKMIPNEPEQEIMMQQYWLGGGDGFEWVEPDQDPLDFLWKQHLEKLKGQALPKAEQKLSIG
ncbi:Hypothetical protein PP7435_CHR2-0975 [Komagataella phaffii CBS 7435]|uniref:Uncharacterized protein n=2 Tax=Komagataella phaffii TaxID=460519 RepID=C4R0B8_KOMPG|nr:Hypothetical protein PAS_chr2-1_0325 [Komagataella phaffii GS115]AOA63085.1 GQ67_00364T0 [Komagataella phaffii]CAH2448552.1 Hypothetical protein BQ9382_C2-5250 [Komagataella phaffii CBS 7435]AOA68024.1 GQ68_01025T0 [Komagataella phaffii GS115]CAY68942.1 Hypothetical protein PAS_chr2-1_0325 [Komagataella phaffii GS115]CCA38656.1 Hypothetical protein PP7435_CHR2-0975 [Komagataella phaffii CBS 7435]